MTAEDHRDRAIRIAAQQLSGYVAPQLAESVARDVIDAYQLVMIAAGLREAQDVAAIIAERDAAIRERDEARAALANARAEALEKAAQWHEGVAASIRRLSAGQSTAKRPGIAKELGREAVVHDQCASAIRALKEAKG